MYKQPQNYNYGKISLPIPIPAGRPPNIGGGVGVFDDGVFDDGLGALLAGGVDVPDGGG